MGTKEFENKLKRKRQYNLLWTSECRLFEPLFNLNQYFLYDQLWVLNLLILHFFGYLNIHFKTLLWKQLLITKILNETQKRELLPGLRKPVMNVKTLSVIHS
jgi:hypothetical protein